MEASARTVVLNGSERTDGFKWKRAHGRLFHRSVFLNATCFIFCAVRWLRGGGNGTRRNMPACVHERLNNRTATSLRLPFQAIAHIMDRDFKIFDSERLITEVDKRPALYNKATPEYSDKQCKEKLWIEVFEAVVLNWSRMDKTARVVTGKSVKNHFYVHCNLFVETVEYSFVIYL